MCSNIRLIDNTHSPSARQVNKIKAYMLSILKQCIDNERLGLLVVEKILDCGVKMLDVI